MRSLLVLEVFEYFTLCYHSLGVQSIFIAKWNLFATQGITITWRSLFNPHLSYVIELIFRERMPYFTCTYGFLIMWRWTFKVTSFRIKFFIPFDPPRRMYKSFIELRLCFYNIWGFDWSFSSGTSLKYFASS